VGLERGPLSLVCKIVVLVVSKSSDSGLENREYGRKDTSRWPRGTFDPQKLTLTSPKSCGLSVGIVRSRIQARESCKPANLEMYDKEKRQLISKVWICAHYCACDRLHGGLHRCQNQWFFALCPSSGILILENLSSDTVIEVSSF
jgi:hypothetical protein